MKATPDTTIDMCAVRREIAAAHRNLRQWEKAASDPPPPHERWTKLVGFAGPNLKRAMSTGTVHIEIPNDGRGKPRFALKED